MIHSFIKKSWIIKYCGITRIRGGSIFVVFVGSPSPRIYILNEYKFRKSYLSYWNWNPTHSRNYIPTNKQKTHNTRKLTSTKLNDYTVYANWYVSITQSHWFITTTRSMIKDTQKCPLLHGLSYPGVWSTTNSWFFWMLF